MGRLEQRAYGRRTMLGAAAIAVLLSFAPPAFAHDGGPPPCRTLAYALDGAATLLIQDALVSRQGPLLPAGSRGYAAVQRALGDRLALDLDYEINLASRTGSSRAVGFGLVWIVTPGRSR